MKARSSALAYRRLPGGLPLALCREACLPLTFAHARCRECAEACPVGGLRVGADGIEVSLGCTGCGRCAAACPTGALRREEAELPEAVEAHAGAVTVDCAKVPPQASPAHAVRVPCLEGVRVSQWLQLVHAAAGRPVEILDRGWCGACRCGATHLPHGSLDEARALLAGMELPAERLPQRRAMPLPLKLMPRAIPGEEEGTAMSRRGFFGSLARGASRTAAEIVAAAEPPRGRAPVAAAQRVVALPERERRIAWLRRLAAEAGASLPPRAFASLVVDAAACADHRVCAAICPTRALQGYDDAEACGLAFDAAGCIECGQCIEACPSGALAYGPRRAPVSASPARLTRRSPASCPECGARSAGEGESCAACRGAAGFAHDAFETLFPGSGRNASPLS